MPTAVRKDAGLPKILPRGTRFFNGVLYDREGRPLECDAVWQRFRQANNGACDLAGRVKKTLEKSMRSTSQSHSHNPATPHNAVRVAHIALPQHQRSAPTAPPALSCCACCACSLLSPAPRPRPGFPATQQHGAVVDPPHDQLAAAAGHEDRAGSRPGQRVRRRGCALLRTNCCQSAPRLLPLTVYAVPT